MAYLWKDDSWSAAQQLLVIMEHEVLMLYSRELTAVLYHDQDVTSPHPPTLLL